MKIATLTAGLFVTAGILLQSCVGLIAAPQIASTEAQMGAGVVIALLGTITAALSLFALVSILRRPGTAAIAYLFTAFFAFLITPLFWDMEIWRWALAVLAFMAFLAWRMDRKPATIE
jgi:hypothetical protein